MFRNWILLTLLLVFAGAPLYAQDPEPDSGAASETEEAPEEEQVDEAEIDDSDLDLQTYEEDGDFTPSEEIPLDEPIPFPSNI